MKYRHEIDGLRAVAVLPVILFHAGWSVFKGGFIGVDIFFVISGYLITSIILSDMEAGRFSLRDFYERRFRRILPALFFVLICVTPFAYAWLIPNEMKAYSQSLVSVAAFSSNILFWLTSGYFETATELKPLLHTWSLGVEEQYYLFFPLIMMLLWKKGRALLVPFMLLLMIASFAASEWAVRHYPTAAFYLLPFRAWELFSGAAVAYYFSKYDRHAQNQTLNQIGSLSGLAMIAVSIFTYSKHTPFPGIYAILPVLGTVLVIVFTNQKTWVGKLLSNKIMVQIGLISYSAYLWHNPLFAFARIRSEFHVEFSWLMIGLSALSLILAYFTWKYVEAPFRNRSKYNRSYIFKLSLLGSVMMGCTGLAGHFYFKSKEPHIDYKWDQLARRHECLLQDDHQHIHAESCYENGNNNVLLWGDSHSAALYQGLSDFAETNGIALTQLTQSACMPVLNDRFADYSTRKNCLMINRQILEHIKVKKYQTIILHSLWLNALNTDDYSPVPVYLDDTVKQIKAASPDSKIVIISMIPRWYVSVERAYAKRLNETASDGTAGQPVFAKAIAPEALAQAIRKTATDNSVTLIEPLKYLCQPQAEDPNHPYCLISTDGTREKMLYIDADHLSNLGADTLVKKMDQTLKQILLKP
ncbi:acyltransferase family protein [Neisseria weaveri]|uniref:Putative LipO-oligosaccharide acyltransferase n=1 Tax=Neisseria weaveri TaxID=28091 RepID=A0A3S5C9X7_9NEIS|nr:acyltransferase family protein [Neisseria weaveri]EGV36021.1 hypothetical protein l13_10450 [Neisseria weaveri ATCC 51223]EGV38811.1 hypothetical protein l11_02580 [Neisseria weaveri LMG 5135]SAY51391.1 putative LipO-oligosaccharide acyltransferase [Neisseria weaveri]VEJ50390.1 putative LipO-oligosaccharide acyltransferase [Neisseria weaveri]